MPGERSVTVGFRMTPEQKCWLDRVAAESGMTKQDFIMARLHDEAITIAPNVRVYRALRDHMLSLLRELGRIRAGGTVDDRLHNETERLTDEFIANDEGDLVFIGCEINRSRGEGFPEEKCDRKSLERLAVAYLADHAEAEDCTVRFDLVSMMIVADNKALLRHHRNALGEE